MGRSQAPHFSRVNGCIIRSHYTLHTRARNQPSRRSHSYVGSSTAHYGCIIRSDLRCSALLGIKTQDQGNKSITMQRTMHPLECSGNQPQPPASPALLYIVSDLIHRKTFFPEILSIGWWQRIFRGCLHVWPSDEDWLGGGMTYYGPNYLTWDTHKPEQGGIFILISDCPSHAMYGGPYFYFRYIVL